MTPLLWIAAVILVAAGLAGTVLPGLPGPVLVFAGLLVAAWADGFSRVGAGTLGVLAFLAVAAHAVDLAATAFGARRFGASRRAMVGAAAGTIAGLFFGLPGLIVGPFAGAVAGELTAGRDVRRAGRAGLGAWLGMVVGSAFKVGLVFVMIGLFLAAFFLF
jgi:uncharacterized protein